MPYLVTNDDARLYYEERGTKGDGPTLVFIPGMTMSTAWFEAQLEGLSGDFHCVSYDPRAQGASSKVEYGHRTARWARDLFDLLAALKIDQSILVGWSLGGLILLAYLDLFGKDHVVGAVIVDAGPAETSRPGWDLGSGTESENSAFQSTILDDMEAFGRELIPMMVHRPMAPGDQEKLTELTLRMPPMAAHEIARDAMYQDYRDLLPRIRIPVLIAVGGHGMLDEESCTYMRERIPDVQVTVFEESGHSPFLEEPEKFNAVIRDFSNGIRAKTS
jgi:pimeloyl-ACP methyl ester carboxylesterase